MRRRSFEAAVAAAVLIGLAISGGCAGKPRIKPLEPKVAPPAIAQAGVLRAGLDLSYPPFGGTDKGEQAGLDVDVAAALADRLGLKLEIVSVTTSEVAGALASGTVDVVVSALPINDSLLGEVTFAGTYVNDGPVFFTAKAETQTLTLDSLDGMTVGVQEGSPAYWLVTDQLGSDAVTPFVTLREALQALQNGTIDVVVGDGMVGAYIARDFPSVRYSGQAAPAVPLGVAVRKDSAEMETSVRSALDRLAADGVLEQLRSKWATPLPKLASASGEGTQAP